MISVDHHHHLEHEQENEHEAMNSEGWRFSPWEERAEGLTVGAQC